MARFTTKYRYWCVLNDFSFERLAREVVIVSKGKCSFLVAYNAVRGEKALIPLHLERYLDKAQKKLVSA